MNSKTYFWKFEKKRILLFFSFLFILSFSCLVYCLIFGFPEVNSDNSEPELSKKDFIIQEAFKLSPSRANYCAELDDEKAIKCFYAVYYSEVEK